MKRPDNTEMDRLLRRHARLGGGAVRGAPDGGGAHMDADEMNAYAEGALPEAARSHYFAHLADCDSCRKLVTELTLAATASAEGRERAAAATVAAPSKSWRERLAAILSPQVLRYSVPALALFAVLVVAIVALRSNRDESSVARNNQTAARPDAAGGTATANSAVQQAPMDSAENHGNADTGASPMENKQEQGQPEGTTASPQKAPADMDGDPAAPEVTMDGVPAQQATPAPKEVAKSEDARTPSRETDQPTGGRRAQQEETEVASGPPPTASPAREPVLAAPSTASETSMRDEEEQRKPKVEGKDDNTSTADGTVAKRSESNRERRDVGKSEGAGAASTRAGTPTASKRPPAGVFAQNEAPSDTRSVGGRTFQRQRGAWVDTAYNPSRPLTNVQRGTEHYRTLVADEPGLRAITNKLGGEVIVVWKTSAYRFY